MHERGRALAHASKWWSAPVTPAPRSRELRAGFPIGQVVEVGDAVKKLFAYRYQVLPFIYTHLVSLCCTFYLVLDIRLWLYRDTSFWLAS